MKILFITDYLPYPLISGDRIRNYNLMYRVARHHQVSVLGFVQTPEEADAVSQMQDFCYRVESIHLPRRNRLARIPGILRYVLAGIPFDFEFLNSDMLKEYARRLAISQDFDIVQIEHSRMAPYLEALPANLKFRSILALHNIATHQYDRISHIGRFSTRRIRTKLFSRVLRSWEPRYAERFDRCIVVSDVDRRLLMSANPRLQVDIVPNGVDTQAHRPLALEGKMPALVFVGSMNYAPCADGAVWFCNEILPHIQRLVGKVDVWIVGSSPPAEVRKLGGDNVYVTGRVEDVVPYYKRSTVSIVPIRAGGGTRLKILEAMALGRPVVSTSIGCEGLEVEDGKHLLVADTPEEFAAKTMRLLTDESFHQGMVEEARKRVEIKYDWEVIVRQLLEVYSGVMQQRQNDTETY